MPGRTRAICCDPTSTSARGGGTSTWRACARRSRARVAASRPDEQGGCMTLNTDPNIAAPDDFYESLIDLHRELSDEQSALVNAKLILLLANHVGDAEVLREAMAVAVQGVARAVSPPAPGKSQ